MIVFDPDLDPEAATAATAAVPRSESLPSGRTLARFLTVAQAAVRLRGQVTVLLTTDTAIRRLNRQFRGKNKATDVLSFPADPIPGLKPAQRIAGDLAISVPTARRQAAGQGHALAVEVKVLMLHGLLHLAGYDHETDKGQMARRERALRAKLKLPQGLIERVEGGPALAKARRRAGARP
ncbi:MAG: rRNA maturation RNase YbeY [Terracidiphilus sp.]|nr:rRNA maturation RNase YbeY [Terracidiphilus sp.]